MKSKTPLQAEHQLDQLAGQFEHWRQTRVHPRARIPQALWDQAVALTSALPPSRVAKHLRLGMTDLKKQMAAPSTLLDFVEVPTVPSWPQVTPTTQIELRRADGTRLSIRSPESTLPLVALVRAFLEALSCSS